MSKAEEYEVLKKDYILKSLWHLKLVEELSYDDFSKIGILGNLASSHLESTTSYNQLVSAIMQVKVKIFL